MGYGGDVCLSFPERIIYIEVEIGPRRHYDVVRFRCGPECAAIIDVFVVHRPIHTGLRFDGEHAYGIPLFERAFLGAAGFRIPGGGGKCDKPAAAGGFCLSGIVPAGQEGEQQCSANNPFY